MLLSGLVGVSLVIVLEDSAAGKLMPVPCVGCDCRTSTRTARRSNVLVMIFAFMLPSTAYYSRRLLMVFYCGY